MDDEGRTVNETPDNERPTRTVPGAADKKGDHQVEIDPAVSDAAPTKGYIDIVPEKPPEGDVPAPPEVLRVKRLVGACKIEGQPDVEHRGRAERHVRVAREIEVNLKSIAEGRHPGIKEVELA